MNLQIGEQTDGGRLKRRGGGPLFDQSHHSNIRVHGLESSNYVVVAIDAHVGGEANLSDKKI